MNGSSQTLSISLGNPNTTGDRPTLRLEQKPWDGDIGMVTKADMINYVGNMLYENGEESDVNKWRPDVRCGLDGDGCGIVVYAYPSTRSLRFQIGASYGELSAGEKEEINILEMVSLAMQDEFTTDYPPLEILDAAPRGNLYDKNGAPVPMPSITIAGDKVVLGRKVYGSMAVLYRVLRYKHALTIERRSIDTTIENFFSSVCYAWWSGDGTYIEIEPPPGSEGNAVEQKPCGYGGSNKSDPDKEKDNKPVEAYADRTVNISYCSGETTSDSTFGRVVWGDGSET